MKNFTYYTTILALIAIAISCSKDDNTSTDHIEEETTTTDVYVVGYSNSKAVYWKNGEEFTLPSNGNAFAISICVTDTDDTYIAGADFISGTGKAVYWKNDEKVSLATNNTNSTRATAIKVSSTGDVYVVGYETDNNGRKAVYWKNGTKVSLHANDVSTSEAEHIHITPNGDIYIVGRESNSSTFASRAVYWKNDNRVVLSDGSLGAKAESIYVTDTEDVYISGTEQNSSGYPTAVYWNNGVKTVFPVLEDTYLPNCSIHIANNKVYVAAQEYDAITNLSNTVYWEDNNKFNLSTDSHSSYPSQIIVVDDDVYVTGTAETTASNTSAVYWKNGTKTALTDGSNDASATGIAIKTSN